jgi:hypothetical protein
MAVADTGDAAAAAAEAARRLVAQRLFANDDDLDQ